jgi:hypothetical protein
MEPSSCDRYLWLTVNIEHIACSNPCLPCHHRPISPMPSNSRHGTVDFVFVCMCGVECYMLLSCLLALLQQLVYSIHQYTSIHQSSPNYTTCTGTSFTSLAMYYWVSVTTDLKQVETSSGRAVLWCQVGHQQEHASAMYAPDIGG